MTFEESVHRTGEDDKPVGTARRRFVEPGDPVEGAGVG